MMLLAKGVAAQFDIGQKLFVVNPYENKIVVLTVSKIEAVITATAREIDSRIGYICVETGNVRWYERELFTTRYEADAALSRWKTWPKDAS